MTHRLQSLIKQWFPLFLISALSLYLELAVVRWIAGEVRVFSYFKNLTLLAAFLGLAIGFGVVDRRDMRRDYGLLLAALFLIVLGIKTATSHGQLVFPGSGEEALFWVLFSDHWSSVLFFFGPLLLVFFMVMFLFVPLGQAVAVEMRQHQPVPAYAVNVLASLVGVWVFAATSAAETPPVLWFGLAALGFIVYLAVRGVLSLSFVGLQLAVLLGLGLFMRGAIWSPYQKLVLQEVVVQRPGGGEPVTVGYQLDTQVGFYQQAYDLSPGFLNSPQGDLPQLQELASNYDLPYLLIDEGAEILIVGAGMGNDVAAALRGGVGHIDAVEIDPEILALGIDLHPEQPYDDPRVNPVVDDARSYIQRSAKQYDAVVFGLLDSHTLLSAISSVRLDSYVYTEQAFRAVRERLKDDGVVSVTFVALEPWIEDRLGRMLSEVFGQNGVYVYRGALGTTFIAGDADRALALEAGLAGWEPDPTLEGSPIPTDDWPYLYLRSRTLPAVYWQALAAIGLISLVIMARSFPMVLRPDWHFWLLGAAFLLIEFKSITELALLFGTTWLVNAIAISGVLVMILLANAVVLRSRKVNLEIAFPLLLLSLTALYFAPLNALNELGFAPRLILGGGILSVPLFFSGLIFGESLRRAGETSRPLASNLSGAMVGALFEYGSLVWGIKSLYLMALGLYSLAWLALRFGGSSVRR